MRPSVMPFSPPPLEASAGGDETLRDDIRRIGAQLGDVLRRQEGESFLTLVEDVRAAAKAIRAGTSPPEDLRALLDPVDLATAIGLARAFSSYFHLANLAEQVHREAAPVPDGPPGLPFVPPPIKRSVDADTRQTAVAALDVRPVFTAHPTEASRRSVTYKRRQVADLLVERAGASPADRGADRPPRHRGHRAAVADRRAPSPAPHADRRGRGRARRAHRAGAGGAVAPGGLRRAGRGRR